MLIDGIDLIEGSVIRNMTAPAASVFPELANIGELFYHVPSKSLCCYTGTAWEYVGSVTAVAGRTGAVVLDVSDVENAASLLLLGQANGIATLDANGKIASSQISALAITNTFVVSSQASMLALACDIGDVAVRTDISKCFILAGANAGTLAHWQELLSPTTASSVTSVAGKIGVVSLTVDDISGAQFALGFTPENAASKNVANGYVGLEADGKILASRLPDSVTRAVTKYNLPGVLQPLIGQTRWYPERPVVISKVYFSIGKPPYGQTVIDVKKNGISIFTGDKPTCDTGEFLSTTITVTSSLDVTDYLTVDIVSANGAEDSVVYIVYN